MFRRASNRSPSPLSDDFHTLSGGGYSRSNSQDGGFSRTNSMDEDNIEVGYDMQHIQTNPSNSTEHDIRTLEDDGRVGNIIYSNNMFDNDEEEKEQGISVAQVTLGSMAPKNFGREPGTVIMQENDLYSIEGNEEEEVMARTSQSSVFSRMSPRHLLGLLLLVTAMLAAVVTTASICGLANNCGRSSSATSKSANGNGNAPVELDTSQFTRMPVAAPVSGTEDSKETLSPAPSIAPRWTPQPSIIKETGQPVSYLALTRKPVVPVGTEDSDGGGNAPPPTEAPVKDANPVRSPPPTDAPVEDRPATGAPIVDSNQGNNDPPTDAPTKDNEGDNSGNDPTSPPTEAPVNQNNRPPVVEQVIDGGGSGGNSGNSGNDDNGSDDNTDDGNGDDNGNDDQAGNDRPTDAPVDSTGAHNNDDHNGGDDDARNSNDDGTKGPSQDDHVPNDDRFGNDDHTNDDAGNDDQIQHANDDARNDDQFHQDGSGNAGNNDDRPKDDGPSDHLNNDDRSSTENAHEFNDDAQQGQTTVVRTSPDGTVTTTTTTTFSRRRNPWRLLKFF